MNNADPHTETRRRRSALSWLGLIASLPVRLLGVILLIAFIPGVIMMWRTCSIARRDNLEMANVALKATNPQRCTRPFLSLGYPAIVQQHLIDMRPEQNDLLALVSLYYLKNRVAGNSSTRTADGAYQHVVQFSDGTSRTISSTTPHLKDVSGEDIASARQALAQLFPDTKQRSEVLNWGKCLFIAEWLTRHRLSDVPRAAVPEPFEGTEDEHAWIAWQVLSGNSPAALDDLSRLPQLAEAAFTAKEDREQAGAWAKNFLETAEAQFKDFRTIVQAQDENDRKRDRPPGDKNAEQSALASCGRVVPPDSEWMRDWLLYRYVGLNDASRQAVRARWLGLFPEGEEANLVALGESIAKERRDNGEPLPAVAEVLPLLCVVERATGSDKHGQRSLQAVVDAAGTDPIQRNFLSFAFLSGYPNDEIFFLSSSNDSLQLYPYGLSDSALERRLERVSGQMILILLAALGATTLLNWVVVPLVVRHQARTLWNKYREGRGKEKLWLTLASIVFFGFIGALAAPWTLPPFIEVQMGSFLELFLASLAATAVGGVLIGTFRYMLAVLLVLCRVDIEENWLDEILGVLLGGYVLFHFGNGVLTILLFALTDIVPGLIKVAEQRGWFTKNEAAPVQAGFE